MTKSPRSIAADCTGRCLECPEALHGVGPEDHRDGEGDQRRTATTAAPGSRRSRGFDPPRPESSRPVGIRPGLVAAQASAIRGRPRFSPDPRQDPFPAGRSRARPTRRGHYRRGARPPADAARAPTARPTTIRQHEKRHATPTSRSGDPAPRRSEVDHRCDGQAWAPTPDREWRVTGEGPPRC